MKEHYRINLSFEYTQDEQELVMLKRLQSNLESRIKRHYLQSDEFKQSEEGKHTAEINNHNKILYTRLIRQTEERMTAGCEALVRTILLDEKHAEEQF